jgi:hypothetical protein
MLSLNVGRVCPGEMGGALSLDCCCTHVLCTECGRTEHEVVGKATSLRHAWAAYCRLAPRLVPSYFDASHCNLDSFDHHQRKKQDQDKDSRHSIGNIRPLLPADA